MYHRQQLTPLNLCCARDAVQCEFRQAHLQASRLRSIRVVASYHFIPQRVVCCRYLRLLRHIRRIVFTSDIPAVCVGSSSRSSPTDIPFLLPYGFGYRKRLKLYASSRLRLSGRIFTAPRNPHQVRCKVRLLVRCPCPPCSCSPLCALCQHDHAVRCQTRSPYRPGRQSCSVSDTQGEMILQFICGIR